MNAASKHPGGARKAAADSDLPKQTELAANTRLVSSSDFNNAVSLGGSRYLSSSFDVRQTTLGQAMLEDLDRFSKTTATLDALVVSAACLRHARPVAMFLSLADRILPLRIFPNEQVFVCPVDFLALPEAHIQGLRLTRIEPTKPLAAEVLQKVGDQERCVGPLGPMLWRLAMSGARAELLPEIDGRACYRVSPILIIASLPATPHEAQVLMSMRRHAMTLDDIAGHAGMTSELACRLLNAVYLQAGLMTLRSSHLARTPRLRSRPAQKRTA